MNTQFGLVFAHDLHAYFVTGARVSRTGAGKVVPMKNRS